MKPNSDKLFAALAALTLIVFSAKLFNRVMARPTAQPTATAPDPIARGKVLVHFGGCTDCHTPKTMTERGPVDDLSRFLAGHPGGEQLPPPPDLSNTPWFAATAGMTAWTGPWGISYAANLTPDEHTGIGIWTEAMFRKAMRTGKHMGDGRDLLPPMPWQNVATLSDEDLDAVFAYLRSIPAVRNEVPQPVPPTGAIPLE